MRANFAAGAVLAMALLACGGNNNGDDDGDGGGGDGGPADACVGLECQVVNCAAQSKPSTTITGTVYAPNGSLPLYGVNVYVPREAPGPFTEGAQCSRCSDELSGYPITRIQTDDQGRFVLENVPAGDNIPLVITTGKWRRQITIPRVEACGETALTAAQTSLPKNKSEGDIPKIAITTGDADSLECLIRKLGIADTEITAGGGAGRIHLYRGDGVDAFKSGFAGGTGALTSAVPLWNSANNLKAYDIVFLSCEGSQQGNSARKTQDSLNAMKAYADAGGRVFASHWHNIWIGGNFQNDASLRPAVWDSVATWTTNDGNPTTDVIDEASNPKGNAFANWMVNVMGSTVRGIIPLQSNTGRATAVMLDTSKAERWVYTQGGGMTPQMFQFTTPNEVPLGERCGKVVFTDMHVSGSSNVNVDFPDNCVGGASNMTLTPQEKALAFMFFDIASCVGPIF